MNLLEAERAIESLYYLKSENRSDYKSDEAFANFREVKVGGIKEKRLFRSSSPLLYDERSFCAEKLCESCGIKTIVNLSDDFENAKLLFNEFAEFNESPFCRNFYKTIAENKNAIFLNLDISFYSKRFLKKLREMFMFLASGKSTPILIHCNEGKDRTGFVCAVLEALCGANIREITEDYMKSFENYFGVQKGSETYNLVASEIIVFLKRISGGKLDENLSESTTNFLQKKAELTAKEIVAVKNLLTKE